MASTSPMATILLTLIPCLFLIIPQAIAQSAPAPAPSGLANLTGILDKAGQYTIFIRLLTTTQVGNQIESQLNNSNQGMTVFAPTDNAFNNLKPGTINSLSQQDQDELVLYHVLPQYYSLASLQTVSNPVRTQAGSQNGVDGLNFTSSGNNQLNVSSGIVDTPLNNALRQQFPLAVYQVDKVMLPESLFGVKAPAAAPKPAIASNTSSTGVATGGEPQAAPSDANSKSGSNGRNVGMGLVAGFGLICLGFLLQ
ncbi:fasciclin-like arabinogalactan protein 13 [Telopea speciosissima]|uniref:fasciclin-like arabinogalactan protein 13 n=1 Tax=Telopea speciosissima TaxID=54955 RepID=UPI001CC75391|nr:fasciclin-like arabinogalactan protein 13 [Telopea speciosissima]